MINLNPAECRTTPFTNDFIMNAEVEEWLDENTPGYKLSWGIDPMVFKWVVQVHFADPEHDELMFMLRWRG